MYFFSGYVNMSLDDAVAATRQVLQRHRLTVLAQLDPGKTLKPRLAANCRPCIILSAYSPELTRRAMQADEETGSIVFCNVLIQEQTDGRVKISAADPNATVGTLNHVELTRVAQDLRSMIQRVIEDVASRPAPRSIPKHRQQDGRELAAPAPAHRSAA
jgi:uncharacterized protein (DUF302 family)